MNTNIATTKEQSARLLQCGVSADTANMSWFRGWGNVGDYYLSLKPYNMLMRINVESCRGQNEVAPAWSLSALLRLLPKEIIVDEDPYSEVQKYGLQFYPFMGGWQVDYQYCENDECHCLKCIHGTNLIEACVKAIEWLTGNNYKLKTERDMKPYRIKHIPTGLYYKPGVSNLSRTGKVYQTANSILTYVCRGVVPVEVRKGSKVYEATKNKIQWEPSQYHYSCMIAKLPITEFEREEMK